MAFQASHIISLDYEPEDSLKCLICLELCHSPWQHAKCGRLFCRRCLEQYGREKPCPTCREKSPKYFEDNKSKREIQVLFRKEYACEFCGIRDTRSNISKHDEICQKKLVPCPNDLCTEKIERCGVEGHVTNDCGYTVISCRYVDIGCEVKLKRHDMPDHERDAAQHLAFAMDAILSMKKTVDELESKSNTTLRQGEPLRLKISDFERKRVNNEPYHSSSFYSCQYHLEIIVYPNGFGHGKGRYASIYARILQGDYDSELTWPFAGKITITLLNQLVDESHYTRSKNLTIHLRDRDGFTQGCSKFILHSKLGPDPVKNTQYLMNDSLHFRIFIQVDGIKHWLQ